MDDDEREEWSTLCVTYAQNITFFGKQIFYSESPQAVIDNAERVTRECDELKVEMAKLIALAQKHL